MTQAERLEAAQQWHTTYVTGRAESEAQLEAATETISTVANLFSASVWKILPQKIKVYFEAYRTV